MNETITATVTAARSAQTTLVNAIHDAADDLSRVGRDPVAEALARLSREAKEARERLEASRLTAQSILFDALQGFESFAAEVTAPVQHALPPATPDFIAPDFIALDYAPEEAPAPVTFGDIAAGHAAYIDAMAAAEATHDATDGIVEPAPTPTPEPAVEEPRGEDAAEVQADATPPASEYPAEECEGCFDFSADVLPRPGGMRLCPSCERSRLDAEAAETRLVGLAVIAAQEGGEVLATAANGSVANPAPQPIARPAVAYEYVLCGDEGVEGPPVYFSVHLVAEHLVAIGEATDIYDARQKLDAGLTVGGYPLRIVTVQGYEETADPAKVLAKPTPPAPKKARGRRKAK